MIEKPVIKRVTMLDVAKQAGVSYQTVSRVINHHPSVAPETRERVLSVIGALNYRPNKAARSLAARQSRTIAVITYTMAYYGPTQMVVNIERNAREAGYDVIFSNIEPMSGDGIDAAVERLTQWAVDGVLLIAPVASNRYAHLVQEVSDIPLIQIDIAPGAPVPSVIVDQRYGSRIITQHLISLGHRRICEISGPLYWFGALARHEGWQETIKNANLEPVASVEGDWTAKSGYAAAQSLLDKHRFTALVVGNDQMALGAISALHARGVRVPEDVSVVGFDDIPESAYFLPPLTTIRQDFSELGRQGLDYLVGLIQGLQDGDGQHVITPELVVRDSTAPPNSTLVQPI
ncbi:MAG: substrate-binding domain-containing protein [Anaerolineae bacterium]|nr:substrate-binding domain-containing protein [Anaerolineae bacterium]